jgi:hypothetical protein
MTDLSYVGMKPIGSAVGVANICTIDSNQDAASHDLNLTSWPLTITIPLTGGNLKTLLGVCFFLAERAMQLEKSANEPC